MKYAFLKRWGIGFLVLIAVLGGLRLKPWNFFSINNGCGSIAQSRIFTCYLSSDLSRNGFCYENQ